MHPLAVKILSETGIQHKGISKHTNEFRNIDFDLVITVCRDAAEKCPIWLGRGAKKHIGFDDPAEAKSSNEEKIAVFCKVRDEIAEQIPAF